MVHAKIVGRASALVANRWRDTSSRFNDEKNDSAKALKLLITGRVNQVTAQRGQLSSLQRSTWFVPIDQTVVCSSAGLNSEAMAGLIDSHAHVVLGGAMGAAGPACGPELGYHPDGTPWFRVGDWRLDGVKYEGSPFMDVGLRLNAMDAAGIGAQILSPNPLTYLHFIPAADAISYCRTHNNELAEIVRANPNRLGGFASLPMQDPSAAALELQRAVNELGLLGAYVGTDPGRPLDDPTLDEVYAACVELDVPFMLHPAPSGLDGPLRDPRMRRWDLDLVIEFSYEEMIAVATVIFGGVLQRHPELDLCVSHAGGSTPMHLAKFEKLAERRPGSPEWLKEPGTFRHELGKLWFDLHVTGDDERRFASSQLGTDRLVFGTNFAGWDGGVATSAGPLADKLNDNATRLFRLPERAPGFL
jgi:aminocarboxymuconate-semialdehyde decarboxylase